MTSSIYEHSSPGAFLECVTKDGRVYGFPFSQLLHYLLQPNPELETTPSAPPEQISLWFSSHDVLITGWHFEPLRKLLRDGKSFTVSAGDSRYLNLKPKECFVAEIVILNAGSAS